jgi:hypothetical protein
MRVQYENSMSTLTLYTHPTPRLPPLTPLIHPLTPPLVTTAIIYSTSQLLTPTTTTNSSPQITLNSTLTLPSPPLHPHSTPLSLQPATDYFNRSDWTYVHTGGKQGTKPLGTCASRMWPWGGQAVVRNHYEKEDGVCCLMYAVWCMVYGVCCLVYVVCCMLFAVCCVLHAHYSHCILTHHPLYPRPDTTSRYGYRWTYSPFSPPLSSPPLSLSLSHTPTTLSALALALAMAMDGRWSIRFVWACPCQQARDQLACVGHDAAG